MKKLQYLCETLCEVRFLQARLDSKTRSEILSRADNVFHNAQKYTRKVESTRVISVRSALRYAAGKKKKRKNCNESSGGLERKKIKEETNYEKTSSHSDGSRIKRFLEYACILRCMRIFKIVCHTCELLTARFISSRSKKWERSNKKIRRKYTPKRQFHIYRLGFY